MGLHGDGLRETSLPRRPQVKSPADPDRWLTLRTHWGKAGLRPADLIVVSRNAVLFADDERHSAVCDSCADVCERKVHL
jgi:hypothetical protein